MYHIYLEISKELGYIPVDLGCSDLESMQIACNKLRVKTGNNYVIGEFIQDKNKFNLLDGEVLQVTKDGITIKTMEELRDRYDSRGLITLFSKAILELELDLAQEVSRELEIKIANKIDDLIRNLYKIKE